MQDFVKAHSAVLCRFRLTGTASTMKMLRSVLGEDIEYGPTCASGPLGGDAQVGTQMVLQDLGGCIFFTDPLTAHPHAEDIATLLRMCDINNVLHATNPTTAEALVPVLRAVAEEGDHQLVPSFFRTMTCPHQSLIRGSAPSSVEVADLNEIISFLSAPAKNAFCLPHTPNQAEVETEAFSLSAKHPALVPPPPSSRLRRAPTLTGTPLPLPSSPGSCVNPTARFSIPCHAHSLCLTFEIVFVTLRYRCVQHTPHVRDPHRL